MNKTIDRQLLFLKTITILIAMKRLEQWIILLGTLPYKTIAKGSTYASLPDTLRHKIRFNVIKDMYDQNK